MSSASVLTITAFTVERYVAICHPLRAQKVSSPSRAIKTVIVIWVAASFTAIPYPVNTRTYFYVRHPATDMPLADSLVCNIPLEWMPRMKYVIQASTGLLFVLPMCVMTVLYVSIGLTLRRSTTMAAAFHRSTRARSEDATDGGSDPTTTIDACSDDVRMERRQTLQTIPTIPGAWSLRCAAQQRLPRRRGSSSAQTLAYSRRAVLRILGKLF
jgi:hypothetical protein